MLGLYLKRVSDLEGVEEAGHPAGGLGRNPGHRCWRRGLRQRCWRGGEGLDLTGARERVTVSEVGFCS